MLKTIALVDFGPNETKEDIESVLKKGNAKVLESKGNRYILEIEVYEFYDATISLYYILEGSGFPGEYEFEIMLPEHYEGVDMVSEMPTRSL